MNRTKDSILNVTVFLVIVITDIVTLKSNPHVCSVVVEGESRDSSAHPGSATNSVPWGDGGVT